MTRRVQAALAAVAVVALVGWALARRMSSGPVAAPPSADTMGLPAGTGVPARPPTAEELVASRYNAVLQVRANDDRGEPQPVGTALPRRLTLTLEDGEGRRYAEQFDRVGQWAIEIPPGTYRIPREQSGLGEWRWTVSGDALRNKGAAGWSITFEPGKMNPMLDLLLF